MKHALILAAGKGQRLGELTAHTPKCLLPVNAQDTIFDFTLKALQKVGISKVTILTGFAEEKLKEHIQNHWKNNFDFKFVYNKDFDKYNNIYSAYLAKNIWTDETILLNSDIIFDPKILELLITRIRDNGQQTADNRQQTADSKPQSYLVIDDHKKLTEEDMKVTINEKDTITRIHKSLDTKTSYGEYIGITYLRDETRLKFLNSLENNVKSKTLDLYYEDALDQIASEVSVFPCSTEGGLWTEVDTKEDYELAKKIATKIIYEPNQHSNQTSHPSLKQ